MSTRFRKSRLVLLGSMLISLSAWLVMPGVNVATACEQRVPDDCCHMKVATPSCNVACCQRHSQEPTQAPPDRQKRIDDTKIIEVAYRVPSSVASFSDQIGDAFSTRISRPSLITQHIRLQI